MAVVTTKTIRGSFFAGIAGAMLLIGIFKGGDTEGPPSAANRWQPNAVASPLELTMFVTYTTTGHGRVIAMSGQDFHFRVLLTNVSNRPVNLWQEHCAWGYYALSFELNDGSGHSWVVRKKLRPPTRSVPEPLTLGPHENLRFVVDFSDRDVWKVTPEPAPWPQVFTIRAAYEIEPDKEAKQFSAWTGRVVSDSEEYYSEGGAGS
jgi:hypothetical protein